MIVYTIAVLAAACTATSPAAPLMRRSPTAPVVWTIDSSNSSVSFRVAHFKVRSVTGFFHRFTGTITTTGNDFGTAVVQATADVASLDTDEKDRDAHLRSRDFLDAARYPTLSLSGRTSTVRRDTLDAVADVEIRGVCKPVRFTLVPRAPRGSPASGRVAFVATASINRLDYGVSWNGSFLNRLVVGETVEIKLDMELVQASTARPVR